MLATVARGLRDLKDRVVFVGGATVDLYITDPAAPPTRVTDDVDCVIELVSRPEYHRLEARLRALGFSHPVGEAGAPICRWRFAGLTVDVMPTDPAVLGFSNRWYSEGIANAESALLPNGPTIAIFTLRSRRSWAGARETSTAARTSRTSWRSFEARRMSPRKSSRCPRPSRHIFRASSPSSSATPRLSRVSRAIWGPAPGQDPAKGSSACCDVSPRGNDCLIQTLKNLDNSRQISLVWAGAPTGGILSTSSLE